MLIEQPQVNKLEEIPFANGYLQGSYTKNGFEISRVISTDLSVYLNNQYSPGQIYRASRGEK